MSREEKDGVEHARKLGRYSHLTGATILVYQLAKGIFKELRVDRRGFAGILSTIFGGVSLAVFALWYKYNMIGAYGDIYNSAADYTLEEK